MSRHLRFLALVIGLSPLVAACGSSPSAPTTTGSSVAGQVLDFQTNTGVPGATVSFGGLDSATVLPADARSTTGASGSYQLAMSPGRYHAWVDGVYRGEVLVRSAVNRTDLLVRDGGCAVRYGTIADAITGRPIAGATVSLVGVVASSGSDGSYRLDFGCRGPFAFAGTIEMSVSRVGYQTRSLPAGRGENLINAIRQDVDLTAQ